MQRVLGNGAVVVKATTPANLDGGVSNVSHHHTPWGTWGTCPKKQSTLDQKWAAPDLSRFFPDPSWTGSISRRSLRGQERPGGKPKDRDRVDQWVVICLSLGGSQRLSLRGCIDFPALNLELGLSRVLGGIWGILSLLSMASEGTFYSSRTYEEPHRNSTDVSISVASVSLQGGKGDVGSQAA